MGVRVVVVGTGFGRRVVAPSFVTAGATVVDVVSPRDPVAVLAACRRPDIDLVSVHSPPFLHRPHVEAAVAAGHAVLCDKPFGLSGDEAATLARDAASAGVVAVTNFEFRLHPGRRLLHDLLTDGRAGTVEHVSWVHHSSGSRRPLRPHGWLFDRSLGGGWIGAWGSHVVDAVRWLFGEVEAADAELYTAVAARPDADGALRACTAEDGFTARLRVAGGPTVAVDSTFAAVRALPSRITVLGSDGVVDVTADATIVVRGADGTKDELTVPPGTGDPHLGPMQAMAELVCQAVRTDEVPAGLATFADGVACARVMDRLRAGSRPRDPATRDRMTG